VKFIKDGIDKGIRCMIGFMRSDDIQAQLDTIDLINKVQFDKRVFIAIITALKFLDGQSSSLLNRVIRQL
jgi:hypothetical protein